jgi:hypothetical protein
VVRFPLTPSSLTVFVVIGVPLGPDTFVKQFVATIWRDIIEDVEKIDTIQDCFIHYQLIRFLSTH